MSEIKVLREALRLHYEGFINHLNELNKQLHKQYKKGDEILAALERFDGVDV